MGAKNDNTHRSNSKKIVTNTSVWSVVIQKVTDNSATIWVGTLFPDLKMPSKAKVVLTHPDGTKTNKYINKRDWKRPFRNVNQRFYTLVDFVGLKPVKKYQVSFDRKIESLDNVVKERWQTVRTGQFSTLPSRIPSSEEKPFTIALGSCFYNHRDGGRAAAAYKALYLRGYDKHRPDIAILAGDQVYLDIGFDSLSLISAEIRQRIANDYAKHWQALGSILSRGGTWMLPDDHEYWNDYPFYDSLIPTLLALKLPWVRNAWSRACIDAVKNIQQCPEIEIINMANDLSICFADLRSYRSKTQFINRKSFKKLINWAKTLQSPGLLVSPQPLIVEENKQEKNLLSFSGQYKKLLKALNYSGHDIVLLTGDVHFGRIATVELPNKGRLIEIIASPLSNLTYLEGIATAVPKIRPTKFPDPAAITIDGWKSEKVKYAKDFQVETIDGRTLSAYPCDRTKEHFITVSLSRKDNNKIKLSAQAWKIRERGGPRYLPIKDFKRDFEITLN